MILLLLDQCCLESVAEEIALVNADIIDGVHRVAALGYRDPHTRRPQGSYKFDQSLVHTCFSQNLR
jgi:hypothetical protein